MSLAPCVIKGEIFRHENKNWIALEHAWIAPALKKPVWKECSKTHTFRACVATSTCKRKLGQGASTIWTLTEHDISTMKTFVQFKPMGTEKQCMMEVPNHVLISIIFNSSESIVTDLQ